MELYPVHLQLKNRTALVVGGGAVAAVKAAALQRGGACVRIIAPLISPEVRRLADAGSVQYHIREFEPSDLDGVWLVVSATDNPQVQQLVYEESRRRNILVCLVDDPGRSDFIVPAVLQRGDLIVTVSTSGVAPALAARIRDDLAEILGESYAGVIEDLKSVRERLKREIPEPERRREAWYELIDRQILPALRRGKSPDVSAIAPVDREEL